jgi:hypothetical protein
MLRFPAKVQSLDEQAAECREILGPESARLHAHAHALGGALAVASEDGQCRLSTKPIYPYCLQRLRHRRSLRAKTRERPRPDTSESPH